MKRRSSGFAATDRRAFLHDDGAGGAAIGRGCDHRAIRPQHGRGNQFIGCHRLDHRRAGVAAKTAAIRPDIDLRRDQPQGRRFRTDGVGLRRAGGQQQDGDGLAHVRQARAPGRAGPVGGGHGGQRCRGTGTQVCVRPRSGWKVSRQAPRERAPPLKGRMPWPASPMSNIPGANMSSRCPAA